MRNNGIIKEKNIKSLSKENNSLKNNLESVSHKLDEMIYKSTSNPRKILNKVNNKKENDYKIQMLIKEKEVNNKQHLVEIL